MRALVMNGPSPTSERTEITKIEEPLPGPGQVTVDVAYAGVNFVDVMQRRGDAGYVATWPHVPGFEATGTVRAVGSGVTELRPGQPVVALTRHGGLAQVVAAPAELVVPLPDGVAPSVAAAVPAVLTTALLLLTDAARIAPGEAVLVHSASGGVGTAVARLAPLLGAGQLIGTVGRPEKVDAARAAGYDVAVARGEDLVAAVLAAAPDGVPIVLDPLGTSQLAADLAVVATGGRIVLFGNASGESPTPLPPAAALIQGNLSIGGFSIGLLAARAPHRTVAGMRRVLDLLADGQLGFDITEIDLAEVQAVHDDLAAGRGIGKYVARL